MTTATASPIKLYEQQKSGVRWLLSAQTRGERGGILADEMGLGKTGTALLAARVHKQVDPSVRVIVIAPKSLGINWRKEA
ncbi:SNF2-related protein, partial [Enterococcus casseliflavus]|uniref:SNF2-related protein n=1 Tax=Enterococcus casseliflavus TaxID=37734 RepID=UPI003D0C359C